jgi:hypothetical protein
MPALTEPVAASLVELQRELARLRHDFDSRVSSIEQQIASLAPTETPAQQAAVAPAPVAPPESAARREVLPETIAIIAAAVTSFLGKKVKIHHARLLDVGSSPWAQQGRAIIQASHNLSR